jgi:hypothetical protein
MPHLVNDLLQSLMISIPCTVVFLCSKAANGRFDTWGERYTKSKTELSAQRVPNTTGNTLDLLKR